MRRVASAIWGERQAQEHVLALAGACDVAVEGDPCTFLARKLDKRLVVHRYRVGWSHTCTSIMGFAAILVRRSAKLSTYGVLSMSSSTTSRA